MAPIGLSPNALSMSDISRAFPQIGETWKHFKGNEYVIIDLRLSLCDLDEGEAIDVTSFHQFDYNIESTICKGEEVVFYGAFGKVYARSLENFLELLGDGKHRFEKITHSNF
jgi:hypothetical protein